MINILYPGGAGGNWLRSVLANQNDNQNHPHWHHISQDNILVRHDVLDWQEHLVLNGSGYFNFFLNHVYKWYHLLDNLYDTHFENYWLKTCAIGKWVCEFAVYQDPDFNFDNLVYDPYAFYKQVITLQHKHNYSIINVEDFMASRNRFLQSCVNPSTRYNNADDLYYVAFVLGQLSMDEIYPNFSIADINNINKCKQFVDENKSRCRYMDYYKIGSVTELPSLV